MPQILSLKAPGRRKPLTFASGLFWHPIMPSAHPHRAVRKIAVEQSVDLYATPRTSSLQSGFGSARKGLRRGMISIAAVFSDYMEAKFDARSFLVALPVDARTWVYVAQHNGVILPDGDITGEEADIRERLLSDHASGEWTHVVAPEHWEVPYATAVSLIDVVAWAAAERAKHKTWALRKVEVDYKKLVLALLGLSGLAASGHYAWRAWEQHVALEQANQLAAQAALVQANSQTPPPPPPWETQGRAPETAKACLAALVKADAYGTGWQPKTASCRNGTLSLTWSRDPAGSISRMRELFPAARIELTGDLASAAVPLPAVPLGGPLDLPLAGAAAEYLLGQAQALGVTVAVTREAPPAPLPGEAPAAAPAWTTMKWRISDTRLPVDALAAHLDSPSLRLSAIDFDAATQSWTLEGELYAKP